MKRKTENSRQLGAALRVVMDAPQNERRTVWADRLPLLRKLAPATKWPTNAPVDGNQIVQLQLSANAPRHHKPGELRMPIRQRKSEFQKAYEQRQVKLQKALTRYRGLIGPPGPDKLATARSPKFSFKYPDKLPRPAQDVMTKALQTANKRFIERYLTIGSFDEYTAVYEEWFWYLAEKYENMLRRVAASSLSEQWSPNGRSAELQRHGEALAAAVFLRNLLASERWQTLLRKSAEQEPAQPTAIKRGRGRPAISKDIKDRALEVRRNGGSWKDAAKVLYDEPRPTARHVKDTQKVLSYYQNRNLKQPKSS